MSALGVALFVATTAASFDVTSDSPCPSSAAVHAAVEALMPARAPEVDATAVPLAVRITRAGDLDPNALVVELAWNAGKRTRSQRIATGPDCGARADAAAVAVASWLGALPGSSLEPPPLETEPLPTPVGAPPGVTAPAPVDSPRPARLGSALGVGLGIAAGGDIAPALRLEWAGVRETTGLSWSVAAVAIGPRRVPLGPATSRWLRPGIELAGRGLWRAGALFAMAQLGVLGTVTFAGGNGYPVDRSTTAAGIAGTGALRLEAATGTWRPWVELRALYWPASQRLRYLDATTGEVSLADLPSIEVLATVGASFVP